MFDNFTRGAKNALSNAEKEARAFFHDYIGSEHILLGILQEEEELASRILRELEVTLEFAQQQVLKIIGQGTGIVLPFTPLRYTPRAKQIIELSQSQSRKLGNNFVGTEHILLGLLHEGEGVGIKVLLNLGLDLHELRAELLRRIASLRDEGDYGNPFKKPGTMDHSQSLDEFSRDLTKLAAKKLLDPVVGRENEMERVIQILSRRKKNNPVLIGEPGVGKTAIVEGLAQMIVNGDIPELLKNKRLLSLDLAAIVAGTKYRGQFESRMKKVLKDITKSKNIVIFIDEIHNMIGAGSAEGSIDASSMMKPALSRGEIQCIGATTLDEYRKYIEKDKALERRFQPIFVKAPTVEETIEILKALRDRYETHHHVTLTDEALIAAAELSDRYIPDRFLPDKAIDLIDEAGSRARLRTMTLPPEIKEVEVKIQEIEKEKIASSNHQEFEKAAKFRDEEKKLKEKLRKLKKKWEEKRSEKQVVLTEEHIAEIVSKSTGIPVSRLEEEESEKLLRMEDELHKRVIGQDEAITTISRAIRRARAGIKNPRRPIGSFIFLGPTGVGKTELAKALSEFLFASEDALIRIDMSEYMEKFAVSRLIGAPPGYVGFEEGGQLTEAVRRRPYSVVLFDEIEKAHPDVFNLLLQILEDGRLTDNNGRTVDFKNSVIIMTSNAGARIIGKGKSLGFRKDDQILEYEEMKQKIMSELKNIFRPEFLNRLDEIIVFHALTKEELSLIVDIMLKDLLVQLTKKNISLELTPKAKELIIDLGYNPDLGARPLRRIIQNLLEDMLSEAILKDKTLNNSIIKIKVENRHLSYEKIKNKKPKSLEPKKDEVKK